MSFFRFIEKLRSRSREERRVISLVGTSAIFLLIVTVWLTTFQLKSERIENEEMYNELSPIASLKDMSTRFIADIKRELDIIGDFAVNTLNFADTDETATTIKGDSPEIAEEGFLSGTSSDKTQSATSSNNVGSTYSSEFTGDTVGDDDSPVALPAQTGGEGNE